MYQTKGEHANHYNTDAVLHWADEKHFIHKYDDIDLEFSI